jgi:hypothetical protein
MKISLPFSRFRVTPEPTEGIRSRLAHLRLITETLIGEPFWNSAEFPT